MSAFSELAQKLAAQGVQNPGGLAATIGRRKFGPQVMAQASKQGVSAASIAKKKKRP